MNVTENLIKFVRMHANDDVNTLRLKFAGKRNCEKNIDFDFDIEFALTQIESRRKTKKKLPDFVSYPDFIFPTTLSAEQASNEAVARFHASLISSSSSLLDLTAGLGIDDMTFALKGIQVTACEIDSIKCEALQHNAKVMGISDNLSVVCGDSIDFISNHKDQFDVVFADPARRNETGGKIHALSNCKPDILAAMQDILSISNRLLVKCSPLLDFSLIKNTVKDLQHIYVVCYKGECKEVLIDIKKTSSFDGITVVDIDNEHEISRFHTTFKTTESGSKVSLCNRKRADEYKYLYEPNAGVMKTGAWSTLLNEFPHLSKADPNTHIFLSDAFYSNFPGRVMQIVSEPDKKAIKALKGSKLNIVSRNHPLSATQIAKKFSLIPGTEKFLYAFRYRNTPNFLVATPMNQESQ
ncbi:MAG: class I SAM-dependent methyltransferase [Muribaculaceae bacterium]|nr:class I SAM-dependent methyltransferase [Muribaculaceae bacterium]